MLHFAIQDWVDRDLLTMKRIDTSANSADALTKATARTLFYRHNNHIMGKIIPEYVTYTTQSTTDFAQSKHNMDKCFQIKRLAQNVFVGLDHSLEQGGMLSVNTVHVKLGVGDSTAVHK